MSPTLILNGYNVVPSSTEHVTQFYGMTTNPPAVAGVTQGEQTFDVVDPITGETVGTFDALKSSAKLFNLGGNFVELLVTNTAGPVGTRRREHSAGRLGDRHLQ